MLKSFTKTKKTHCDVQWINNLCPWVNYIALYIRLIRLSSQMHPHSPELVQWCQCLRCVWSVILMPVGIFSNNMQHAVGLFTDLLLLLTFCLLSAHTGHFNNLHSCGQILTKFSASIDYRHWTTTLSLGHPLTEKWSRGQIFQCVLYQVI